MKKQNIILLSLFGFLFLLKVLISPFVEISADEAHYFLYGINLKLSYVDHPPLVGWIHALFINVFPEAMAPGLLARIPTLLLSLVINYSFYLYLKKNKWSPQEILYSLLFINSSLLYFFLNIALLPDTLLMVLLFPLIMTLERVEEQNDIISFASLGLLLGLAGISKYSAVFFVVSLLAYVVFTRQWKTYLNKKLLLSIGIAFLCILPVLIWNAQNEWLSFNYQINRVLPNREASVLNIIKAVLLQVVAFGPFTFLLSMLGGYYMVKHKKYLELFIATPFFVFFIYSSKTEVALPHWSVCFYMIALPFGIRQFMQSYKDKAIVVQKILLAISFILLTAVSLELIFKWNPGKEYYSLHRDIFGWEQIMNTADDLKQKYNADFIAVPNWTQGSRAMVYTKNRKAMTILDERNDQFDQWTTLPQSGQQVIVILTHFYKQNFKPETCKTLESLFTHDIKINNKIVNTIEYKLCEYL